MSRPDEMPTTSLTSRSTVRVIVFLLIVMGGMLAFTWIRNAAYPDLVPWREDVTAARAQARTDQKPMLLNFTADWCPPCRDMTRHVYSQRPIANLITDTFVPIRVDMSPLSPASPQAELADHYQVQYLPTLIMTTAQGREQRRLSGFHEADKVKSWLTQPSDP